LLSRGLFRTALLFSTTVLGPTACAQQASKVAAGPNVGERIPAFEATDQHGRRQTFESLRGPKGALLVFFRSADW